MINLHASFLLGFITFTFIIKKICTTTVNQTNYQPTTNRLQITHSTFIQVIRASKQILQNKILNSETIKLH